MRKNLAKRSKITPKRTVAEMLAFVQLFILLPTSAPINVMAAGNVEYNRIKPEVSVYNAQTGIDEKLYEREISGSSNFNAATKSSLFNLSFDNNLVNNTASFNLDDKELGRLRKKDNNLKTSISASFHNYKHQHTWKSGFLGLKKNTANVTTAGIMSCKYHVSGYNYTPNLAMNSRDIARDYERISTDYKSIFSYNEKCNVSFAVSLQGTMYDGGNKSCTCPGDASVTKPVISYMDDNAPSIVSVTGIDNRILKAGDTVDLEVKFDEPIRFADDSAAHDDLYVNLAISGISSDRFPKAMLKKLDTDTLYFSYTVPSDTTDVEQTITSVDFSPLMQECDLSVVFEDESFRLSTSGLSNSNEIGYTRATSYITDIAGNGMREANRQYNVTEAYIDTKAPSLNKASIVVNANNTKIKEMLGSTDADNSDIYLGAGDSVEYGLIFSEVLNIEEGEYTGVTVDTNLNTADGSPVTLTSKTVSRIPTDDNAYGLGPSKGNVTYIDLGTLNIEDGMTCTDPDGVIRIKSVRFSSTVSDLAENDASISDEYVNAINRETIYLDVERPEITTTLNQIDDVYSVVPYDDNSGFYIPFEIRDNMSGTNGLEGSFRWNKGENSIYGNIYYYAVTSSADKPGDSEWTQGHFNISNSFKQVEGTQYLHIKKIDGITYELLDTDIGFTATDYAGNEYSSSDPVTFKINAVWDNTYPLAKLGEVIKELNAAGGTMTVNVNLTEATALKDARYLWTDTEDEPSPEQIDQVPAGDVEGQTAVTVTITQEVMSGEDFNKYLWVKVSDNNGNEMIYNLGRQRYNLGTIGYDVNKSEDYDTNFYFHFASDDGYLLALHPVPGTTNEYYASVNGGMTYDAANWYKVSSDDRRNFTILEKTDIDNDYLENYLLNNSGSAYSSNFGYRNGVFEFYVLAGTNDAFTLDENGYVTQAGNTSYNVSEESYTVRVLTPNAEGQDFYQGRSVTTKDNIPELPESYYYHSGGEGLSTLAGLTFDFDLGEDISGLNYDALDLDKSYIYVYSNANGYSAQYKLNQQRYQSLTLPEDDYPTGTYNIALILYNKGKNSYRSFSTAFSGISIDSRKAPDVSEFGINYLQLKCDPTNSEPDYNYQTGITEQNAYPHGDIIYMPTSNSTDMGAYAGYDDTHRLYLLGSLSNGNSGISGLYYSTNLLIWNVTAGQTEDLAAVNRSENNYIDIQLFDEAGAKEYVSGLNYDDPADGGNASLCMIKNTVNVIAVRAALDNGEKSEIKYYSVYPSWLEMSGSFSTQTNDDGSEVRNDSQLIYTPDENQSMDGIRIYAAGSDGGKKELLPQADGTYRCDADPGKIWNYFHAVNETGSIYYFGGNLYTMRDNEAPVITYESSNRSDGDYIIKFKIDDMSNVYYRYDNPIKLKLTFDEEYSERLGYEAGQQASFEIDIDEFEETWGDITPGVDDKEYLWEAQDVSSTGIYRVEVIKPKIDNESYMEVTVYGSLKYIPEEADGISVNFGITAEATDKFGYTGSAVFDNISAVNTKPHVINEGSVKPEYSQIDSGYDYALKLPFSTVVQPEKSWIMSDPTGYQKEWSDAFPITKDGTTEISFYDIFGTYYTQQLELVDVFGEYGLDLTISPETYTKELISVSASMADENTEKALMFWQYISEGQIQAISDANNESLPTKSRTISRQQNGTIMIFVYDRAYSRDELYQQGYYDRADKLTIHIDNMINGAPEAEPRIYLEQYGQEYTEDEFREKFPDGIETTGSVEVWYKTSRFVTPIEDTGEKVKFTYQTADKSHLFKYVDDFGNEGSLEINLEDYGITFAAPPEPYKDQSAPTLVADVYAKLFNNYTVMGAFSKDTSSADIKQEFENIGYVQGYSMKIGVTDYSSYKIVVLKDVPSSLSYSNAKSDEITGVSVSGNTITITKDIDSDFVIVAVDNAMAETASESDNFSYVTVKRDDIKAWFDTTKPLAEQVIVPNGLYEQIAYVRFTDRADDGTEIDPSTVTILNGVMEQETAGDYTGWYKKVFIDNTSSEIIFQDHVGNIGDKATVEASGIDTEAPTLTTTWTPPYVGENGEIDTGRYTAKTVNTSVYAHIVANKAIDVGNVKLTHYTTDGWNWVEVPSGDINDVPNSNASYTVNTEGITVCFDQGGTGLRFNVPSPNGKTTTVDVYLPAEIIDKVVPKVQTETTEIKRDGFSVPYAVSVRITPDKSVYCSNYGTAGKLYDGSTPLELTITQNGTYEYSFVDAAGNSTTTSVTVNTIDRRSPQLTFNPDPAEMPVITTDQKITVTADEVCTLTFDGKDYSLTPDSSQEISFSRNGVYTVIATDAAGNESILNIPVGSIDTTPPDISFENNTIRIRQDSDAAVLTEALNSGVTAWEPETQKVIEDWTYDASAVDLTTVGIYKVVYTAEDAAKNVKTATRYVSVYDKNNPGIYLDGELIEPEGTTVIKEGEHEIKVDNIQEIALGILEPYTVKISKGISTIGQAKFKRSDVEIGSDGKFNITPGFYTVSVITQSRKTFRAILYVEK